MFNTPIRLVQWGQEFISVAQAFRTHRPRPREQGWYAPKGMLVETEVGCFSTSRYAPPMGT